MRTLQKSYRNLLISVLIVILLTITKVGIIHITSWVSIGAYPLLTFVESITRPLTTWRLHKQAVAVLQEALIGKKQEIDKLNEELIYWKSIDREGKLTEELRIFCSRYQPEEYRIARIIKHITTNDEHSIIIDAGAHHGVTPHMIVISHNCLVGRVETVFPYHSKIITVTDRRSKIPIQCTTSQAVGIYVGMNNNQHGELLFISHLQKVVPDDLILSSGNGHLYPAGFALGTVKTCTLDHQALHYKVTVQLLTDITQLTHVALLKSSSNHQA